MNNALINRAANNIRVGDVPAPKTELNPEAVDFVNDLFKSLQIAYPAWKYTFPTQNDVALAKRSWVKTFMECGITSVEQIQVGMRKARADESDFFPSAGKFVAWCKPSPEDLGLPTVELAYREAAINSHSPIAHRWSHAAVYQAGKETGWFFLKSEPQRETQAEFKRVYADICERVMSGHVFAVPKPSENALEHHSNGARINTEENKKTAAAALSGLRGMFRGEGAK